MDGGQCPRRRIIPAHAGNSSESLEPLCELPDHPRACGELSRFAHATISIIGSSPRMRGTHGSIPRLHSLVRIIPAHAGNSACRARCPSVFSDHPRACGELEVRHRSWRWEVGSSPRMRGTLELRGETRVLRRIIPAHAGNSREHFDIVDVFSDHPRACGELEHRSPTGRICGGSSPRMRGTHSRRSGSGRHGRIIPAHAGNSSHRNRNASGLSDHPRACGELSTAAPARADLFGSSPRMRGTRWYVCVRQRLDRIIPAHAGNSKPKTSSDRELPDHPRACGELNSAPNSRANIPGSSPRMRGTRMARRSVGSGRRIIPAHAGNSR